MDLETVLIFSVISFFYVISPGPAIFLALSNGIRADVKALALSSLGNIIGLLFISSVSILGLGAIILSSVKLFLMVKIVGAAYLVYLGIKQFKISKSPVNFVLEDDKKSDKAYRTYFVEGLLLASSNPKAILFFIAIFLQFIKVEMNMLPQFFTMTFIFMAISFMSLFGYGLLAKTAKRIFDNQRYLQWFHRITGGIFIGMGLGLLQLRNT